MLNSKESALSLMLLLLLGGIYSRYILHPSLAETSLGGAQKPRVWEGTLSLACYRICFVKSDSPLCVYCLL
ncbi:hypothetical protein F4803DRAFT_209707 [Xylaria telfairii]|nr:hypothetical protein F4803DRAFT_209707 [Xylaria telfairii]